ncbi:MAG: hypothetical protein JWN25_2731, partial [Verrucomicrobiales bacterium]|nr:hypothetical protein [Verrucomicrobiales bacterium]
MAEINLDYFWIGLDLLHASFSQNFAE